MKLLPRIAALALAALLTCSVQAHVVIYEASLSGPAEAPPNASPGTGFATITFDLDLVTMRVVANFSGLTGNVTAAHIHAPTAVAGTGTASVASQTPSFTSFPTGVISGTYDHTFDMTAAPSYNASFITANGGTVSGAMNALIAALDAGKAYLNIHSSAFPGGEIRGFLAVSAIPEPSSVALCLGGAALGVATVIRRRRNQASV